MKTNVGGLAATWHTQKVGPFTSTGGYDWWSLSWHDPGFLTERIKAQGKVGLAATFSGPVNAAGDDVVPYPPMHQHHVHIVPSNDDVFLVPYGDWASLRLVAIHSDWDFSLEEGLTAVDSMGQDYAGGVKLIAATPSINWPSTKLAGPVASAETSVPTTVPVSRPSDTGRTPKRSMAAPTGICEAAKEK